MASLYTINYQHVTGKELDSDFDLYYIMDLFTPELVEHIASLPNIKRGDIIEIDDVSGYRNDGKVIWDGNTVMNLCFDIDDYGSVPPEFTIGTEFLADHWIHVIEHNNIVWIDPKLITSIGSDMFKTQFDAPLGHFDIYYGFDDGGNFYRNIFLNGLQSQKPISVSAIGPNSVVYIDPNFPITIDHENIVDIADRLLYGGPYGITVTGLFYGGAQHTVHDDGNDNYYVTRP